MDIFSARWLTHMGFFNLSKAFDEVKDAFGAKETAIAGAKLLGKGVVNVAQFAATTGLDTVLKSSSEKILNKADATEEQRMNAMEVHERACNRIAARKEKERLERESEG
ncbi:hypothetical protein [Aeromonas allosaccharophila]|uniref:hypothetical protein n=1 Tax=Aeromonas allosaccharophila TaxID=656 RepID=UPI000DD0A032|nr:hypothetical protein [Aeromonas allosaccharophila]